MTETLNIVALEAQNSLEFIDQVFRLYDTATPFAVCRPGTDLADYPALRVVERIATEARNGWAAPRLTPLQHSAEAAQIVFSSGTEGKPKAIVLSRTALADVEDRLIEVMQITSEIREYIGVPVTYSFGLGRARVVARAGGAFYLPERFDPVEIRDLLAEDKINAISAVPSLWRILLAQPDFLGALGQKVRWIEIGSQYMSGAEKAALRGLFPKARIVQHYGLTEASRSTFLRIDGASPDDLESVGAPIGATEIRIGDEGEICIKGPHLASGILNEDGSIAPIAGPGGWLHTRDRGEILEGKLHYRGRLDDQINLSGIKLAAETLEQEVGALVTLEAGHFALTAVEDALRGEALLLAHDSHAAPHSALLQAALVQVLAARGIQASGQMRVLSLADLPRTGSGKIQRKAIRALWHEKAPAQAASGETSGASPALTASEARIAEVWRGVLGPALLHPDSGFYDVGGDSLGAMQIGLAMEQRFPRSVVRATLEGRSLADLGRLLDAETAGSAPAQPQNEALPERTLKSWAVNLTRGLMVISVILSHWMPAVWERLAPHMDFDPIALISRMGTPGFSVVFGLGIACFMLEGYPGNALSLRRRQRFSILMVFSAILALAAIRLLLLYEAQGFILPIDWGVAFFNVLSYYFLALLAVPLILRGVQDRVFVCAALGIPLVWLGWLAARAIIGHDQWQSPLEWLRLMLIGFYSIFHMFPLTLAGIALGHWMMRATDLRRFARDAGAAGLGILGVGVILILEIAGPFGLIDRSAAFWSGMVGGIVIFGCVTAFLGGAVWLIGQWSHLAAPLRLIAKGLILLGGLALPAYVLHELAIPLKDLLIIAGLPGKMALLAAVGGFFAFMAYGMWRLNRMYFR